MNFFLSAVILLLSFHISAQNQRLDAASVIYFDPAAIQTQGIRSAHTTTEITEKFDWYYKEKPKNEPNYVVARKRMEVNFNERGLYDYMRYGSLQLQFEGYEMFTVLGDEHTNHEKREYDDQDRIIMTCYLSKYREQCEDVKYDNRDNIISVKTYGTNSLPVVYSFHWENDKMIDFERISNDSLIHYTYSFDDQARVTKMVTDRDSYYEFKYVDTDSTLEKHSFIYLADTLFSASGTISDKEGTRTYFSYRLNSNRDTISTVTTRYDDHKNVTYRKSFDQSERLRFRSDEHPPPKMAIEGVENYEAPLPEPRISIYEIENFYANDLLVKRSITIKEGDGELNDEIGAVMEYVRYEKEELPVKSWLSEDPNENEYGY